MSIVEETLRELQNQDEHDEAAKPASPPLESDQIEENTLEESKFGPYKFLIRFSIGMAVLGIVAFIGLDIYQSKLKEENRLKFASQNEAELFARPSTETVAPANPTETQAPKEVAKPTKIEDETVLDTTDGDKSEAPAPVQATELENKPAISVDEKPQAEYKEEIPTSKEDQWIKEGWIAMEENRLEAALELWEDGFLLIPGKQIVLIINVFYDFKNATALLQKIGKGFSTFIVKGKYLGKDSFYLVSAPPHEILWTTRDQIAQIIARNLLKGNFQEKVLAKMRGTVNNITKTPRPDEEEPIAQAKQPVTASSTKPVGTQKVSKEKQSNEQGKEEIAEEAPLTLEDQLNRIKNLLSAGSYAKAVETLKPLINEYGNRWELYYYIGTAYLGLGDLDTAGNYLDWGLAINGTQPQLWGQRAIVAQQKGEHEAALIILSEAERLDPTMPEVQLNIGCSHDALGNKKLAETAYRNFLKYSENNSSYLLTRGKVQERLLELNLAIKGGS